MRSLTSLLNSYLMDHVKQIYLKAYLGVMALYVFLNKGIAYTYLVEALWLMGLFIIFLNRKSFELILNKNLISN